MLSSALVFSLGVAWAAPLSLLEEGSHCVAYKAEKTMFLLKRVKIVGRNCDVSAQILPEIGDMYNVEVNMPVRGFRSGDEDRDKDVLKILKADQRPELTFRSKSLSGKQWRELFAQKDFDIDGELFIGDRSFPIKLRATYLEKGDSAEIDGIVRVNYKDFDLKPPKVGGGVVAKAKPDIELHFHLLSSRILGADTLRLGAEKK